MTKVLQILNTLDDEQLDQMSDDDLIIMIQELMKKGANK